MNKNPSMMHKLEKYVLEYIQFHKLVSRGDKLVLGVSGGADSISLLFILHSINEQLGISLHVAHLDHCIRGDSSLKDAEFVASIVQELELPSTIEQRDVLAYWQNHRLSLEEAAREVRYQFLEEVLKAQGAASVAIAHTLNDHIETVMLHLLRGSGLKGLVGLERKSTLSYKRVGPLRVIRPLLCLSRDEVEQYCKDKGLEFRTDATNLSLSQTRNRIRLKLLPRLRKDFNPRIDDAIDRLSRLAADDVDFIEEQASQTIDKIVRRENGVTLVDKVSLNTLHVALRRAVLKQILVTVAGSPKDIEATHIEDMMDVAEGDTGSSIDLIGGLTFAVGYRDVMLGHGLKKLIPLPEISGQYPLIVPGVTEIPGWRVVASIVENAINQENAQNENRFSQVFDYDVTGSDLVVRTRKSGDRFQPLGMDAEKSVKDFYIDAKVPRAWRPRVPLVVNPGQILWVVGYRPDDRAKVTSATQHFLRLEFMPQTVNSPVLPPAP